MARRKPEISYRQEAATRVLYFTGAFVAAAIIGCVVGLIAAAIFNNYSDETRARIFGWTAGVIFAITCSVLVYKIDLSLNKKFNKNP